LQKLYSELYFFFNDGYFNIDFPLANIEYHLSTEVLLQVLTLSLSFNNSVPKRIRSFRFVKKKKSVVSENIFLVHSSLIQYFNIQYFRKVQQRALSYVQNCTSVFARWSIMTYISQCGWNIFLLGGNSCRAAKKGNVDSMGDKMLIRERAVLFLLYNMLSERSMRLLVAAATELRERSLCISMKLWHRWYHYRDTYQIIISYCNFIVFFCIFIVFIVPSGTQTKSKKIYLYFKISIVLSFVCLFFFFFNIGI